MAPMVGNGGGGVWGNPTALIDWCEENYVVTTYVAEFWNTLRSVLNRR